jgi:hypothetical protein
MNSRTTNQRESRHSKLWRRIGGAAGAICLFAGLPANSNAQSTAVGTDFSFLLDFGANKPVAQPDTLFYVSPNPNTIRTRSYLAKIRRLPPR